MELHYKRTGEGSPIIILHGLFGMLDNWTAIAKRLAVTHEVFLVDQRNHGRSPHSKDFNYQFMSEDLNQFISKYCDTTPDILGHSMGGKTAMNFAVMYPNKFNKLIIIDIAPKAYDVRHQTIIEGLFALKNAILTSRTMADDELVKYIPQFGVRQFLLKNLYRTADNTYAWRMNLDAIAENINEIGSGLPSESICDNHTLFIGWANSDYIMKSDYPLINSHFRNSEIEMIENAGHWVHAEQPEQLIGLITKFLAE